MKSHEELRAIVQLDPHGRTTPSAALAFLQELASYAEAATEPEIDRSGRIVTPRTHDDARQLTAHLRSLWLEVAAAVHAAGHGREAVAALARLHPIMVHAGRIGDHIQEVHRRRGALIVARGGQR